jgi:small GTP-binding protein
MKDYQAKNIRNVCVVGHGSEGKTTLVEALLFSAGAIDRQGRVEDGTTTTDHEAEEISRHISISAAMAPLEWKETKINVIDVPGYFDFAGELVGPMAVSEAALIVVGALQMIRIVRYNTSAKYKEETDTAVQDERNRFLSTKAWSWAGYLYVLIAAIASIVFKLIDQEILMFAASGSVCVILILYWISYFILRKKY